MKINWRKSARVVTLPAIGCTNEYKESRFLRRPFGIFSRIPQETPGRRRRNEPLFFTARVGGDHCLRPAGSWQRNRNP